MTQPSIGFTALPLIVSPLIVLSKSAGTAGREFVGQTGRL